MAKKGNRNKKTKKVKKVLTNAEFATKDDLFKEAVEAAQADLGERKDHKGQVNATTRTASKWRNQKGLVYKHSKGLIK
jgi:hypothetical protein